MIANNKEINECYSIDVIELRNYVDKYVRVSISGGKSFEGVLFTVDPVSKCVVLYCKDDNSFEFIFGHAVDKIAVVRETGEKLCFFEAPATTPQNSGSSKTERLLKLKNWLLQNRIPIKEVGNELKLGDVLTIKPPYDSNCCLSTNEIVLANVQRLIQSMPSD